MLKPAKVELLCILLIGISINAFGQSRSSQDRALLFAVNDYTQMTDLSKPIQNAQDIAAELKKRYGFSTEIVTNPDFAAIETKIQEYQRAYRSGRFAQDGQLFVFFSGHGVKRGNNGYFMPADADPARPYAFGVEYDYWRSEINNIDCKHILVAIDACHSITFDPSWENKPDRNFSRPGERFADQTLLNHDAYRARLFFTSDAVGDQTPDRSTFANQLLAGLRSHRSTSGYLTSSELFGSYLKKAAPTPGGGTFGNNEPGSCFLFFQPTTVNMGDARADRTAWQQARQANTAAAYRRYLQDYPTGEFRPLAEQRLTQLEAEERELLAWEAAKRSSTRRAYQDFISAYPGSVYLDLAKLKRDALPEENTKILDDPFARRASTRPPDNMVLVQGGSFKMGSENGNDDEEPVHSVTLNDFYVGRFEVTFDEYDAFCTATNRNLPDDEGWGRGKRPVINVSWFDAVAYCNWLSEEHRYQPVYNISGNNVSARWSANGFRLPTEAEWEFVSSSGGKTDQWAGTSSETDLASYGNHYVRNVEDKDGYEYTAPVGAFRSNALGLFDMSGNIAEWCWDWYDHYSSIAQSQPTGSETGPGRVIRGGSWYSSPTSLRCRYRSYVNPKDHDNFIGFRLSRSAP